MTLPKNLQEKRDELAREYFLADSHLKTETGQEFRIAGTFPESGMITGSYIHVIEIEAYRKAVEALKVISQYTSAYSGASSPEANLAKETLRELGVE